MRWGPAVSAADPDSAQSPHYRTAPCASTLQPVVCSTSSSGCTLIHLHKIPRAINYGEQLGRAARLGTLARANTDQRCKLCGGGAGWPAAHLQHGGRAASMSTSASWRAASQLEGVTASPRGAADVVCCGPEWEIATAASGRPPPGPYLPCLQNRPAASIRSNARTQLLSPVCNRPAGGRLRCAGISSCRSQVARVLTTQKPAPLPP